MIEWIIQAGTTITLVVLTTFILVITYSILHLLVVIPTEPISRIYTPQFFESISDNRALGETINRSRKVIIWQQLLISVLIIGITLVAIVCYLEVKTAEEATALLQQFIQLGTINIAIFSVIYFGGKFFINSLDPKSDRSFLRGLILSTMFGTSTVLTLIFIPRILGQNLLIGSVIAIELALNLITDVFITFYEVMVKLYWDDLSKGWWKRMPNLSDKFWNWLTKP